MRRAPRAHLEGVPRLSIIITSTRPERQGTAVADWFVAQATAHAGFDCALVDLAEVNLPLFDEPKHPKLGEYVHPHTRAWSQTVAASDAFVFILPEYNHFPPPAFVNAIDFLLSEWAYKAAGFVSYGGISGGTRASELAKLQLTTVKVMPMFEQVTLPMIGKLVQNGKLTSAPHLEAAAKGMLDELLRWTTALQTLRQAR